MSERWTPAPGRGHPFLSTDDDFLLRNSQMLYTPTGSGGDLLAARLLYCHSIFELHGLKDPGDQFGPS
jgi:hypothetical protein